MGRMFQIHEEHLAELEKLVPQLGEALVTRLDARLRTQLRRTKSILSDIRWNYGPPGQVEVIPANDSDDESPCA